MVEGKKEEWKWITEYPEYSISSLGRVRHRCWLATENGSMYVRGGHELKLNKSKGGYLRAALYKHDGHKTKKMTFVHRLVAEAFIPNPEGKIQVNHINGVKYDNSVENLEWVTRSENQQHAVRNGLYKNPKGEKSTKAKLKDIEVKEIKWMAIVLKISSKKLAESYNVSTATINRILAGNIWKHIPNPKPISHG